MPKLPQDPRRLPSLPVRSRSQFPRKKGVYWSIANDEVLYIGMTSASGGFWDRWSNHEQYKKLSKANARVYFLGLNLSERDIKALETAAIHRWWPPLNKAQKPQRLRPSGHPHKLRPQWDGWLFPAIALLVAVAIKVLQP